MKEPDKKAILLRLSPPIYQKNPHPIGFRPPYILKYIEALLRKNTDCEVQCFDQQITGLTTNELIPMVRNYSPHYMVLDISILNYTATMDFLKCLKARLASDIIIIGIGQKVSADVGAFRDKHPQFDILFAGEAEQEVTEVIRKMNQGVSLQEIKLFYEDRDLKNRVWTVDDLDRLPFLNYEKDVSSKYSLVYPLKKARRLKWGHILTSRGCPHPCIFCSQLMRESYGRKVRFRSADHVVNEMEYLINQGVNIIAFDDDNFTNSCKHVKSICEEITNRKLKVDWIIHARIDEVPASLLKLLSDAGCVLIRFGLESRVERILALLDKTNDVQKWIESAGPTIKKAQSLGISVACLFQVGCPTETFDDVQRSIDYAKSLNPDIIQVHYFTPFPGTAAYDMFKEQVEKSSEGALYHYGCPTINLSDMTDVELQKAQGLFYKKFLLRPLFIVRHFVDHLLFYIMNRDVLLNLLKVVKII
jgi:radical SAM superfamily enzyme YgiQ (UPF0313 family)